MQFRHVGWGLALVAVMAIFICLHLLAEVSRLDSARIKLGKWNPMTQNPRLPKMPLPTPSPTHHIHLLLLPVAFSDRLQRSEDSITIGGGVCCGKIIDGVYSFYIFQTVTMIPAPTASCNLINNKFHF